MEFTFLHSCFTFPKFSFSMRSTDLSETQGIARSISKAVRGALRRSWVPLCPMTSGSRPPCRWLLGLWPQGCRETWGCSLPGLRVYL